jgi:hypothetical protein
MAVTYSTAAINARLQGVIDTIDASGNGFFLLKAGSTTVSTIQLSNPCGTVSGGVLTFSGTLLDDSADATGTVDSASITDASGNVVVSGLTVGIPLTGAEVIISNGLNSLLITAGDVVALLSAEITGS